MLDSLLDVVTPVILTYNEAPNIARTLAKLGWAKRIIVIDSGSSDATLEIVRATSRTEIIHRSFDNFANQLDFGLSQVRTPWVLTLDADYVLSDELIHELGELSDKTSVSGYEAHFIYCIDGRPL